VRVVVGDAEIPLGSAVASTLTGAGVRLTRYPARTGGWTIHSKYLLIDAPYVDAGPHRRLVFTGSHNWTGPALTINDETLLRVEDDGVFAAYLANWERTRVAAARP
jgi:phosphatidylserine/phosphatidylglycerophosphate/cardiolipin synthase-like enzyme